jgi:hypothetical protein
MYSKGNNPFQDFQPLNHLRKKIMAFEQEKKYVKIEEELY